MYLLSALVPFVAIWDVVASHPTEATTGEAAGAESAAKFFSAEQVEATPGRRIHFAEARARTFWKHGWDLPEEFETALRFVDLEEELADDPEPKTSSGKGKTTVPVKSAKGEAEFLLEVKVGKHNMWLDPDTGSADLWVMSTLMPSNLRGSRPANRIYDTRGGGTQMKGHTWTIRYGDRSTATGQVYLDRVQIGALTVAKQAVEAASTVSASFARDPANDGLLGLAFSGLNTVTPARQKTWFDNIRGQLEKPVFSVALKRHAAGSYDFGFIDPKKVVGEINWVPIKGAKGFWDFNPTAIKVGGAAKTGNINAIADTGSSLWYMPKPFADFYWSKVPGATFGGIQRAWMFPCSAKLPDVGVVINGKTITVPGINMNYQQSGGSTCFGGLQPDSGMPFSIFGDVFMKHLYLIHEHAGSSKPRLGFAQSHKPGA